MRGSMTKNTKKHAAFTLAEILLVLMIIGVISVLTVPGLMSNAERQTQISGVKKAHSTLNQALEKTKVSMGRYPRCYYFNPVVEENSEDGSQEVKNVNDGNFKDCPEFFEEFFKNLNVQKECEAKKSEDGSFSNDCLGDNFNGKDKAQTVSGLNDPEAAEITSACSSFSLDKIKSNQNIKVLTDGMIVIPHSVTTEPIFVIDTNGKRGPNRWGFDVHQFKLTGDGDGSSWQPIGCGNIAEPGGLTTKQMLMGNK